MTYPDDQARCTLMAPTTLAQEFDDTAGAVDPTRVSNSKWRPVDRLIAEQLGLDAGDVYTTTVSKGGNLDVRFGQSPRARRTAVGVAMFDDDDQVALGHIADSAVRHLERSAVKDLVVLFMRSRGVWVLAAVFHRAGSTAPSALLSAWPNATVVSV